MVYVTREEMAEGKEPDLLTYLRYYTPQELVHIRESSYCIRTHDSLKLFNGKRMWWS